MENSPSSASQVLSFGDGESPEESGWTAYLEDFLVNNTQPSSFSLDSGENRSVFSEASSSVTNRLGSHGRSAIERCNMINLKKRKTKTGAGLVDDALEDTASSPANSPKVSDLRYLRNKLKHPKEVEESTNHQEKTLGVEQQEKISSDVDFIGKDSDCTELRKKGLCLVPLSVVLNYFG